MKVLVHACCGPCLLYPVKSLKSSGHEATGFFYNPNIHPYREYLLRLETLVETAGKEALPLIIRDNYDLELFLANVASEPDRRCDWCYLMRLQATASAAVSGNFDAFTTTLLYSRYQQHEKIAEIGKRVAEENGISFFYEDFRRGWQEGIKRSKELGLYRQQYCGCVYSEKERYLEKGEKR